MKIFQVFKGICYNEITAAFPTLESTIGKFSPDTVIVEAPDYVFQDWGYDSTKEGDERFIKPTAPDGWRYDDKTGTFFQPELLYEQLTVRKIREKYSDNEEYKILRERLAKPDDETAIAAFAEYNDYVEQCKNEARNEVYGE